MEHRAGQAYAPGPVSHRLGSGWADSFHAARLWISAAVVVVCACVALRDAVHWYEHDTPGVLLDASGSVSAVAFSSSGSSGDPRLRFGDSLEPAALHGGESVGTRARVEAWDRAVETAHGRGYVDAVVSHGAERHHARLPLGPLEPLVWWTFAAGLVFVGLIQAGAGLVALWSNPESKVARAFASFALMSGLCLASFFDAHTARSLAPLLAFSLASLPFTGVRLALHVPATAGWFTRDPRWERWERWGNAVSFAVGLGAALFEALGTHTERLFPWLSLWFLTGLGVLSLGLAVRTLLATTAERRPLHALLLGVLPPYLAVALALALLLRGVRVPNELFYASLVVTPFGTLFAFARYDLWGSRALLSRLGTNLFLGAVAAVVAIGAGTAVATSVGASFQDALTGAIGSGVAAAVLVAFSLRLSDVTLFRSRAEYKPTIDRLSEELITLSSPSDVAHAVERTVRRWLRCDYIALTLAPSTPAEGEEEPACSPNASIRLVVSFGGRPYGWLDVGGKRGSALFTSDDIDLLRTIANHGGLALAHAHAYQELEERRRRQAEAWRGEREALVETVAAEIAHEIRYPLNYFRSLFDRSAKNTRLTADDVDVGLEEVDRLERLVSGLKRMVAQRTERQPTHVAELCARVEALLHDSLGRVRLELEIGADATLSCDPDKLTQVMVNLISNAVEACGPSGHVGIAWTAGERGGELSVWDDGPGFVGEASRLFAPWYTTKDRGTGLGLAITHRLVRAHAWTISAQRREGRTLFTIAVSAADIVRDATALGERESQDRVRVA